MTAATAAARPRPARPSRCRSATGTDVADFDPYRYVDREAQQALLRSMIAGEDDARVLVLRDEPGQGKTVLLQRMRINCRESEPSPPVMLMDLRDLSTPFGLIERIVGAPPNSKAISEVLTKFQLEYQERSRPQVDVTGPTENVVTVTGPVANGAVVTGTYVANAPSGLQNLVAQNQVVHAFLDDLRMWDGAPVVL